jgi:hypothetical protein
MPRKLSEWNKTVKKVYNQFKGTMVKGKPFSFGDALKKASSMKKGMKKSMKKACKGKRGTRRMRGGNLEEEEEEEGLMTPNASPSNASPPKE